MTNIRKISALLLVLLTAVLLTGCGCGLDGRWTEYKYEEYALIDNEWILIEEELTSGSMRDPIIAEFSDGRLKLDGAECEYEIEDSYLRLYQNGYLETDLIRVDGDKMVIKARYDDQLKIIYFRKN